MKQLILTSIIICSLLSACNQTAELRNSDSSYEGPEYETMTTESAMAEEDYDQQSSGGSKLKDESIQVDDQKLIKTVDTRFQVDNVDQSTQQIETLINSFDGSLASMNQVNSRHSLQNYLTVRIPSERLDSFVSAIQNESIFTDYTRMQSQDVTEEYLDIQTRLKTKKEVRDRYIEILRNKARTVADVLNAEEKIRVIQEEIESIEGRLKYINNKSKLSTIHIEIYQQIEYVQSPNKYKKSFFKSIGDAFLGGFGLVKVIIIGLVSIWPILILLFLLLLFRRKIFSLFK